MQYELEVIYLKMGKYIARKFMEVAADRALKMFEATCSKLGKEGKECLVILRIEKDGQHYIINSQHVNKYEPKTTIPTKVRK